MLTATLLLMTLSASTLPEAGATEAPAASPAAKLHLLPGDEARPTSAKDAAIARLLAERPTGARIKAGKALALTGGAVSVVGGLLLAIGFSSHNLGLMVMAVFGGLPLAALGLLTAISGIALWASGEIGQHDTDAEIARLRARVEERPMMVPSNVRQAPGPSVATFAFRF